MKQGLESHAQADNGGGLITLPNLLSLPVNATPNCLNIDFGLGGVFGKRAGSTTTNTVVLVSTAATGFSPDSGGTLATEMAVYWKLDEASGDRQAAFGSVTLQDSGNVTSAIGKKLAAAQFTRTSSQQLTASSRTLLQVESNRSFSIAGWAYLDSKPSSATLPLVMKGEAMTTEYGLEWESTADRFQWRLWAPNGTDTMGMVVATTFGAPNTATWYWLAGMWDSANQLAYLQVNNFGPNSSPTTGSPRQGSDTFHLGNNGGGQFHDGRLDEWGVWKKVLSAQERADLYNTGNANTYNSGFSNAGWGSFDFGAGETLRWHVVAAGTGIFASSNRGLSYVTIGTDRLTNYQEFERSKNFLVAVSETHNRVLYWAGSVGTVMLGMPIGSAPAASHALDFDGWLFLMNETGGNGRLVKYADNNTFTTDAWTKSFEVASSQDDEITGGIKYNTRAYIFTKYTTQQVTAVGGNPDFSVKQVKTWGAVPRTIKKVTYGQTGEVIICLGWDRKVRIFDGAEEQIVSTNIEQNNGLCPVYMDNINQTHIRKCHAEVDTNRQTYELFVVMAPSTEVTHRLSLNLRTGAWSPHLCQNFNTAVMADSSNSRVMLAVKQDGLVYQFNTGNTDAGVPISELYDSRPVFSKTPNTVTKHHQIDFFFLPTSSGTLYYQEALNVDRTFLPPRDQIVLTGASNQLLVHKAIDTPVTTNLYQFRLSSSGSTAQPWTVIRYDLVADAKGLGAT